MTHLRAIMIGIVLTAMLMATAVFAYPAIMKQIDNTSYNTDRANIISAVADYAQGFHTLPVVGKIATDEDLLNDPNNELLAHNQILNANDPLLFSIVEKLRPILGGAGAVYNEAEFMNRFRDYAIVDVNGLISSGYLSGVIKYNQAVINTKNPSILLFGRDDEEYIYDDIIAIDGGGDDIDFGEDGWVAEKYAVDDGMGNRLSTVRSVSRYGSRYVVGGSGTAARMLITVGLLDWSALVEDYSYDLNDVYYLNGVVSKLNTMGVDTSGQAKYQKE
jgi:hypothetical protein